MRPVRQLLQADAPRSVGNGFSGRTNSRGRRFAFPDAIRPRALGPRGRHSELGKSSGSVMLGQESGAAGQAHTRQSHN
jgi:hypothetical protein